MLILGAGFGGLELAARLSESLRDELHITLIDQNDSFIFGFSKLEILFGRQTRDAVHCLYRDISRPGVEFRQERVTSIEPQTRHVVTDGGSYEPDILVVALGADYDAGATTGFLEDGYEAAGFGSLLEVVERSLDPLEPFARAEERFGSLRRRDGRPRGKAGEPDGA